MRKCPQLKIILLGTYGGGRKYAPSGWMKQRNVVMTPSIGCKSLVRDHAWFFTNISMKAVIVSSQVVIMKD